MAGAQHLLPTMKLFVAVFIAALAGTVHATPGAVDASGYRHSKKAGFHC